MTESNTQYVDNARFQRLLEERWKKIQDINPEFDFTFSNIEFQSVSQFEGRDLEDTELKQLKKINQQNEKLKHDAMANIARPRISEEIGLNLYKISENLSYRYNFINYSYRDEMVGDGAETCVRYVDRYDTVKYKNPFAYFTQTCFYAFVRRIKKETGHSDTKLALTENQMLELGISDKYDFQNSVVDSYYRGDVK